MMRTVIPAALLSSDEQDDPSSSKATIYYRPSLDAIITLLRKKVDHFAAPAQCGSFDHIVRSLARDGLLEDAKPELVRGELLPRN